MRAAFSAVMRLARETIIAPRGRGADWSPREAFEHAKAAGLSDAEALARVRTLASKLPAFRRVDARA